MKNKTQITIIGRITEMDEMEGKQGTIYKYFVEDLSPEPKVWNITSFDEIKDIENVGGKLMVFDCYLTSREYTSKDGVVSYFLGLNLKEVALIKPVFENVYNGGTTTTTKKVIKKAVETDSEYE